MTRDVRVVDIQDAISTIVAWSNGSAYLPEPKAALLKAICDLLEQLLANRDELEDRS